jgi:hypothetical protein
MWIQELESNEGSTATKKAKEIFFLSLVTFLRRRRCRRLSCASLSNNVK